MLFWRREAFTGTMIRKWLILLLSRQSSVLIQKIRQIKSYYPNTEMKRDREFAVKLFRATILNADVYQRYMSEASRNWDFSRLAYMDICHHADCYSGDAYLPNIPVSVTINEYVDLAKLYSTPRSGGYINGV